MSSTPVGLVDITRYLIPADAATFKKSRFSPEQLLHGLNFHYKDEIWNLRIALVQGEECLFIRAHSKHRIHAIRLELERKNFILKVVMNESEKILKTTQGYSDGVQFSPRQVRISRKNCIDERTCLDALPSIFAKILENGAFVEMQGAPKVCREVRSCAESFFKKSPELIPEVEEEVIH